MFLPCISIPQNACKYKNQQKFQQINFLDWKFLLFATQPIQTKRIKEIILKTISITRDKSL
ncbi:unnamed protein product [Paramecium octaurelia]|uniref:Uncharacterized protein n=1 Tax=Paramecium octaurelia TaxID=43137 RepID=A0A8S1TZZ7_PAROT|nr:unnamed protein product [Paramecium octaurelia]